MIVLVTGDRRWKNRRKIWKEILKRRKKVKMIIEGGARGADFLANECAKLLGIQTVTLDANWTKFGPAAGPIRNAYMLKVLLALPKPRLVLAFHRNLKKSLGTRDMVKRARAAKVRVKIIK